MSEAAPKITMGSFLIEYLDLMQRANGYAVDLSELPRENVEQLAQHLLQVDRLREASNVELVQKLQAHEGNAVQIFAEWVQVQGEMTVASDRKIRRIIYGAPN